MAASGARQEDRSAAQAQARQVQGVVAEVEAARAETELRSPVGGEVVQVLARQGELSPQGVAVVTVVDLADQWVVLNVREDQLARFAQGSRFTGRLPGLDNREAGFEVYYLGVLPDFATWRAALAQALQGIAAAGAEALVVSLGVDTFEGDPVAGFRLKSEDYLRIGEDIARAGLPTVFVFEGGYAVAEVGINAVNVLQGFDQQAA